MKYGFKRYGKWNSPYWKNDKDKNAPLIINANSDEYSTLDLATFKDLLKDELDVPDYEINEENIKKEFGYDEGGLKMSDECIANIISYYTWRKELFERICKFFLNGKQAELFINSTGADELRFKYFIPAKYNNFSTEDPSYDGGQVEAYIEVVLYR